MSPNEQSSDQRFDRPVQDFSLPDASGVSTSLGNAIVGKRGAIIVFWSGLCSHCQRYDDWLGDVAARHPELALVVVASRQNEGPTAIARVIADRRLRFPVLVDVDRTVASAFRVEQTPRAFLVDAERRLRYRGAIDNFTYPDDAEHQPYLEAAISDFLDGRPIRRAETPSFGCPIASIYYQA